MTDTTIRITIFWFLTPCNLELKDQRFGRICFLHLQGSRLSFNDLYLIQKLQSISHHNILFVRCLLVIRGSNCLACIQKYVVRIPAHTDAVFSITRWRSLQFISPCLLAFGYRQSFPMDKTPTHARFKNLWSYNSSLPNIVLSLRFELFYSCFLTMLSVRHSLQRQIWWWFENNWLKQTRM